jgi:predicted small metal-binding protein
MPKEVTCPPCGAVISGAGNEELIASVHQHIAQEHGGELPEGMTMDDVDAEVLRDAREVAA